MIAGKDWERPDPSAFYRNWHTRSLPDRLCVSDIDQIEWRYEGTTPVPYAVLELAIANPDVGHGTLPNEGFFHAVLRKKSWGSQGRINRAVAKALGVPYYIVVLDRDNLNDFWVLNATKTINRTFQYHTQAEYVSFLEKL